MHEIANHKLTFNKEFEVLEQSYADDGYIFGGYVLTFNSELLGHKINMDSETLMLSPNANINFRKDINNELSLPLTIDHSHSIEGVMGNFISTRVDNIGVYARAKTTNKGFASKIKDKTLRYFSSEVHVNRYTTTNKVDLITDLLFQAVSVVNVPADSRANIMEFSLSKEPTNIKEFSTVLRNLGLGNKEANTYIARFKQFLSLDSDVELNKLINEVNKYKKYLELQGL